MSEHALIFVIFLIFTGAAIFSTVALVTRQSLLVAYMLLGMLLGPWSVKYMKDPSVIQTVGDVGIIFLLFLLGLNLPPQKLYHMLRKVSWVGFVSSLVFAIIGFAMGKLFSFGTIDSVIIGAAMMFSSTIIGIKLLPTTILHHQHTGEVMISVLLFQDLIAIIVLLLIRASTSTGSIVMDLLLVIIGFPVILLFSYFFERVVLVRLFGKFNRVKEYVFLLAIAWCLSMAELASFLGLSAEIGAFIAGVSLASSPISLYIAESLKPIRDFFLVLFFFAVGASFNLSFLHEVIIPALVLALILFFVKPITFRVLLHQVQESKHVAWEVGVRLGQISEFSLIIAYVAIQSKLISDATSYLIQATAIISFIISSYMVVMRYPTPMALSEKLRRD